jgi:hypothetical protein
MVTANLSVNEQATRNLGRPAIKGHNGKTEERTSARPTSLSRTRHLDVDAVLERSLPKVVSE